MKNHISILEHIGEWKSSLYFNRNSLSFYRPDFVYESSTLTPKICEINARFPLNGYFMTYYGFNLSNECPELKTVVDESCLKLESVKEIGIIENLYEKVFDMSQPIGILKNKEVSTFLGK